MDTYFLLFTSASSKLFLTVGHNVNLLNETNRKLSLFYVGGPFQSDSFFVWIMPASPVKHTLTYFTLGDKLYYTYFFLIL